MYAAKAIACCFLAAALVLGAGRATAQEETHDDTHAAGAESAEHAGESQEANPLAIDLDLAGWTAIVFAALMFVLWKVAWGPITEALAAREQGITDNIAAAENAHEEAKKLLAAHEAKLAGAADEVRELLEEARRDAEATKATIVAEARAAADAERQRAVREIDQARAGAIKNLAEHSANLAIDLAAKVVRQEISQERQGEIVREALSHMASVEPSNN